ncbi:MAG: hypothetical protein O3C65_10820 [Proteobacteria bacterium]|nr:hypothetical protein [Pseudomonadota bacterium]MDA1059167.1 hypothetical protein [Pseudomonadota bacterium]
MELTFAMILRKLLVALILVGAATPAVSGSADIVSVDVRRTGPGLYRFDVTLRHPDTGWAHYADKWEVLAPDGRVLATRTLLHPHVEEQPFTRSLGGVNIPPTVGRVTIRGHDNVDGYGKVTKTVEILPLTE